MAGVRFRYTNRDPVRRYAHERKVKEGPKPTLAGIHTERPTVYGFLGTRATSALSAWGRRDSGMRS